MRNPYSPFKHYINFQKPANNMECTWSIVGDATKGSVRTYNGSEREKKNTKIEKGGIKRS